MDLKFLPFLSLFSIYITRKYTFFNLYTLLKFMLLNSTNK